MTPIDYTIDDFNTDIDKLVKDIKASEVEYDLIIGLSRGGLIPGVVLSHKLGVSFTPIEWSKDSRHVNKQLWNKIESGDYRILVVDDMVDTGELLGQLFASLETWTAWNDHQLDLSNIDLAVLINNTDVETLFDNDSGSITATYCGRTISRAVTPNWITYWWEQK